MNSLGSVTPALQQPHWKFSSFAAQGLQLFASQHRLCSSRGLLLKYLLGGRWGDVLCPGIDLLYLRSGQQGRGLFWEDIDKMRENFSTLILSLQLVIVIPGCCCVKYRISAVSLLCCLGSCNFSFTLLEQARRPVQGAAGSFFPSVRETPSLNLYGF